MASIQKRKKSNGEYSYRIRIRVEGSPIITSTYPTRKGASTWSKRRSQNISEEQTYTLDNCEKHL